MDACEQVAVAVCLGPTAAAAESRVRLVGASIDASDAHDPGKTIKCVARP